MPEQLFLFVYGQRQLLIGAGDENEATHILDQFLIAHENLPQAGWILKQVLGKLAYGVFSL